MKTLISLILLIGLTCSGCMPTAAELQALGKDHSTLDVDIVIDARPWFQNTLHVHRANPFLFAPTSQPATQPVK